MGFLCASCGCGCYNKQVTFRSLLSASLFAALPLAALPLAALPLAALPLAAQLPQHLQVHVTFPGVATHGRLLVFAEKAPDPAKPEEKLPAILVNNPFQPGSTFVAAVQVPTTAAGSTVDVDVDSNVFPTGFSTLPAGPYVLQALLDTDGSYNYGGDDPTDWISAQVPADAPFQNVHLVLQGHPAESPRVAAARQSLRPGSVEELSVPSAHLTAFSGRPTAITGVVVLPPNYQQHAKIRYPTAYLIPGFGGSHSSNLNSAVRYRRELDSGELPPMILVLLDEDMHTGTHEFVDSVNNGPWGSALVEEAIPALERMYRMDAKPQGRFLNGHSSGGWATLQLQINHPDVFGGTWSTSPDPSDFHNFTGVDLYAPNANMFHRADGTPYPLVRDHGTVIATIEQFSRLEEVLGTEGGQLNSFDWVFSPRAANGRPVPIYDRSTGNVDPAVIQYWHDHYDLAVDLKNRWPSQAKELRGKLHIYVGTADTFYLDGAAHLFDVLLQQLNAGTRVEFLPERTHFDLYTIGSDRRGLEKTIFRQMYAVARTTAAR